jgi:Ca-activated chloride channel homolog
MSFQSGWRLLLLVLPLALLVGYVLLQRRRHTQVLRFTSVDLLDSVAPRRQGWQRHVPSAAMLLALVVLTLAFAEPAVAMRTPKDNATIILTLDTSASMTATDVAPSRLAAAEAQASQFVENLPRGIQVGLVAFDRSARLLVPPTTDRAQLTGAIRSLAVGGGTATASGIRESLDAIAAVPKGTTGKPVPAAIVLMSDGSPTIGDGELSPSDAADAAAAEARAQKVPVNTIAFGTADGRVTVGGEEVPVPIDPDAMAGIATASGGRSFTAESAGQLGSIYSEIGRDVAYTVQTRDLTAAFAGFALLTAVLAAAGALLWTQRLV